MKFIFWLGSRILFYAKYGVRPAERSGDGALAFFNIVRTPARFLCRKPKRGRAPLALRLPPQSITLRPQSIMECVRQSGAATALWLFVQHRSNTGSYFASSESGVALTCPRSP